MWSKFEFVLFKQKNMYYWFSLQASPTLSSLDVCGVRTLIY